MTTLTKATTPQQTIETYHVCEHPASRRRFRKLALSVCLSSILGLGLMSNAQAHCKLIHPGHCIQEVGQAIVNLGEEIVDHVIEPVGEAIIEAGESVAEFTEEQFNNAVDALETAYHKVEDAYLEIKDRVETIANAQKTAREFAEAIHTDLGVASLAVADGLKDGKYTDLRNGLDNRNAGQVLQGLLHMFQNMASQPFNNLVDQLNEQGAKSLLIGFQFDADVTSVLSSGTQMGLAIDVTFLNWLRTQLNNNIFNLSQLNNNHLSSYPGSIGSMFLGGSAGFSGSAGVGNLGSASYFIGFHVNAPDGTQGETMDFETSAGTNAVGVSYNFKKFYQGEMAFEAVVIGYYNNGTGVTGSEAGIGFSVGTSKTLGTLCPDGKFHGGTNDCITKTTIPSGIYTLQQVSSDRYLDAYHGSSNDHLAITRSAKDEPRQQWAIGPSGEGYYSLVQQSTKRYLDGYDLDESDYSVMTRPEQNDASQQWVIIQSGENYLLRRRPYGRYLDAYQSWNDNYKAVLRAYQPDQSQEWRLNLVSLFPKRYVHGARLWGGNGGGEFDDIIRLQQALLVGDPLHITKLGLRAGHRVDRVEVTYSDGSTVRHGGNGGGYLSINLSAERTLKEMEVCKDYTSKYKSTTVHYIKFTLSDGATLAGGRRNGDCTTLKPARDSYSILGFRGSSGAELDSIGTIVEKPQATDL